MFELAAATGTGGAAGIFQLIWPFILMFGIFYFLLIRPQQKKQKARTSMLSTLQKGDKVVTIGGLHGRIVEITDDIIVLLVNDSTRLTFDRSSISTGVRADTEVK
ncbi:preprotein translocase subunit YajC [Paenibacillus sp. CMAA1364]